MRTRLTLALAVAALGALAAPAAAEVHRDQNWSWAGPASWDASYGAYGITISSPTGASALDLGFSSVLCTPATSVRGSVDAYLAEQRRRLRRGARILSAGPVRAIPRLGLNYFRQAIEIGARVNGIPVRGSVTLDYQVSDPTYCYQRSLLLHAPTRGFQAGFRQIVGVRIRDGEPEVLGQRHPRHLAANGK